MFVVHIITWKQRMPRQIFSFIKSTRLIYQSFKIRWKMDNRRLTQSIKFEKSSDWMRWMCQWTNKLSGQSNQAVASAKIYWTQVDQEILRWTNMRKSYINSKQIQRQTHKVEITLVRDIFLKMKRYLDRDICLYISSFFFSNESLERGCV